MASGYSGTVGEAGSTVPPKATHPSPVAAAATTATPSHRGRNPGGRKPRSPQQPQPLLDALVEGLRGGPPSTAVESAPSPKGAAEEFMATALRLMKPSAVPTALAGGVVPNRLRPVAALQSLDAALQGLQTAATAAAAEKAAPSTTLTQTLVSQNRQSAEKAGGSRRTPDPSGGPFRGRGPTVRNTSAVFHLGLLAQSMTSAVATAAEASQQLLEAMEATPRRQNAAPATPRQRRNPRRRRGASAPPRGSAPTAGVDSKTSGKKAPPR